MAYGVRVYADILWLPEGAGGAGIVVLAANSPGYGAGGTPGIMSNAQTLRFQQAEMVVPATFDVPSAAEIGTALTAAATDIQTQLTTAIVAQIQAWRTGGP